MRVARHCGAVLLGAAVLGGCMMTQAKEAVPALLVTVNAEQKASIAEVISQWFGGTEVTIADDVFTRASTLSIERKAHNDKRGLPIDGRHNNPAFTFSLLKRGDSCVLRNNQTGDEQSIEGLLCKASDE